MLVALGEAMNIEIRNVSPTPREFRAFKRGWGAVHWACIPYTYAFLAGFAFYGIVVSILAEGVLPPFLLSGSLIGTWLIWLLAAWFVRFASTREARKAPAGSLPWDWRIGPEEIVFTNGLQTNRCDWRAVKLVREEDDRFIFLVSPAYNPVLPKRLLDERQISGLRALVDGVRANGRLGAGLSA